MCDCSLALVRWEIEILVCWKILFFIRWFCMSWKNCSFPQNKSFPFIESFTNFTQSRFLRTKTAFARAFLRCPQKIPIFTNQKPFFRTNLSLFPPKTTLFHPPLPISTPLNLLFAKNTAVLFISALTPCAVKPEPRTDSNHCRRYPETCSFQHSRLPDECRTFSQQSRIDRRFESRSQDGVPRAFWLLFARCKKWQLVPFPGNSEVLQTSNQHTAAAASHRNN